MYNNSLTDTQFYILMIFHRCEDVNYCRRKCRRSWQLHIWVIWLSRNCDWRWVWGDGSHSSFWMDDGSLYEFVWTKLSSRCIKHFPTFFLSLNSLVQLPATADSSKAATLEGPDPTDPLHTTPSLSGNNFHGVSKDATRSPEDIQSTPLRRDRDGRFNQCSAPACIRGVISVR